MEMLSAQSDVLLAPNVGRSRHLLTEGGARLWYACAASASLSSSPHRADEAVSRAAVQSRAPRAHLACVHAPVCRGRGDEVRFVPLAALRFLNRVSLTLCSRPAGLPGNEAARLRQYSQLLMGQWEVVRNVKRYRTPLTTRCFGRIANLMHPFIMGPYCACTHTTRLCGTAD